MSESERPAAGLESMEEQFAGTTAQAIERITTLMGDKSALPIPRKAGGSIILTKDSGFLTVVADLPPNPKFSHYRVEWRIGVNDPEAEEVIIDGTPIDKPDSPFHDRRSFFTSDDIAALHEVLDKAEDKDGEAADGEA